MAFLPAQVASILEQLAPGDELVVVDDASRDATPQWLGALGDARVRIERQAVNRGVRPTFERALQLARHDVVLLADQDDVWLPGKRAALARAFDDPAVMAAVSDAEVIDGSGRVTAPSFMATRGGFRGGVLDTLVRNRYLGCAMAIRQRVLAYALPFPADLPMHDMWLGALARSLGRVVYLDRPLLQYRRHGGNASPGRRAGVAQMAVWRWRLARSLALRRLRSAPPAARGRP
jgi:glycosyltransferase involved in cell wall biosynthesis